MSLIDQAKANEADHTQGGDGKDFVAPAGLTMARFIGYVEVGKRPQKEWKGQPKPDASEARFTFELLSPKNIRKIEVDGETTTVTDVIGSKVSMKTGDRAAFVKLLRKMAYGREGITNHAQMLGEAFLINVIHAEGEDKDKNKKTYANMKDADFNWTISAPVQTDALTGNVTQLPVPEPTLPLRLLLWDNPTPEQWASVFIDGTRTVKNAEGQEVEESKNWLQRDIVTNALNFGGSPLEQMLNGVEDLEMPGDVADEPVPDMTGENPELALAKANLAKAEAAAKAAITASNEALENAGLEKAPATAAAAVGLKEPIKGRVATVTVTDDPPTQAEQLAAAKAIIAQLTGK